MDYKAKYEEALERAKTFQEQYGGDYAGFIFPELAESEEEKEKKIIGYIRHLLFEHACENGGVDVNGDYCKDEYERADDFLKSLRPQPKCLPGFDEMTPEEKMNHPLYLEGFDAGRDVGKVETDWKPSEEQIRCLDMVLCDEAMDDNVHSVLVQLKEQLKKLMEE